MLENGVLLLHAEPLWDSPWVFSVFVALREKGLTFDVREIDLASGENRAPAYRDATLTGKVPVIEHDGFVLTESSAIVEYLEEAFPAPTFPRLHPADLRMRARSRQLMSVVRSDFGALREERPTTTMFFERATQPLSTAAQAAAERLIDLTSRLLPNHGSTLFGEYALVDSELAFMLHRLLCNGDSVPDRVRAYAEAQWARPSVQAFVQHPRRTHR